jgi:integrase
LNDDFWNHLNNTPKCEGIGYVHPKAAELYQVNGGNSAASLSNQFADILFKVGLRKKKVSRRKTKNGRDTKRDFETLNFHCFRYTPATLLHENGASQAVAQQILGHDECSYIHQLYVKIRPEPIRDEIKKNLTFHAYPP